MAISTAQYIDLLVKKLVGVSKTDTNPPKAPSNESIASPPLIRGDLVWTQSDQIPATAQTVAGITQSYLGGSSIQCVADPTVGLISGVNPTWLTNLTDWIPPEFGSTWLVKVYAGPPSAANIQATGTQLFATGSGGTGEYFYDNQAGLLNFIGNTIPASLTVGNVIYVAGYRYVGLTGTTNLPGNTTIGNLFFDGTTITSNVANGNITLTADGTGNVAVTGNISAQYLYGNGSQLTGITSGGSGNTGNITFDNTTISSNVANANVTLEGNGTGNVNLGSSVSITGNITSNYYYGNGYYLTGLPFSTITNQTLIGNNVANTFVLNQDATADGILVTINGINQTPDMDYTVTGNVITFTTAPYTGDTMQVRFLANNIISGGGGNANTGNVTFDNINIIGTGNLNLQPNGSASEYLNIYLTGAADIHVAYGGGSGNVILGTDEEANIAVLLDGNVAIQAGNVAGTKTWTFDTAGNLTLPLGSIVYETNIPDGALSGSAIALKPIGGTTANQQLLIYPTAFDGDHIHLTSGNLLNTELYLGNDDFYVKLANTGNIIVNTAGNTAQWIFGTDGTTTFPTGNITSSTSLQFTTTFANVKTVEYQTAGVWDLYVEDSITGSNTASSRLNVSFKDNLIDKPQVYIENAKESDGIALRWTFDENGNLNFPRDVAGNTDPYLTITGGASPRILSEDASLAGPANLEITALNTIFTGSSGSAIKIYPDDGEISSTANLQIWANSGGNTEYSWTFDDTGNLTLPGNTFAVNYANGTQVSIGGGGNANTGNVTFSDQILIGTGSNDGSGGLYLAPGNASIANSAVQYLRVRGGDVATHIHLDTGNNAYFDQYFGDDGKYVKLANTGNVVIGSDNANGNSAQWTFGTDGNLTTSSNLVIGPGAGSGSRIFQYDEGLEIVGEGANSVVAIGWTANTSAPDSVTTIAMNYPGGGEGNILIAVGNNATTVNYWLFDNTGTLTLPAVNDNQQQVQGTQQTILGDPFPTSAVGNVSVTVWTADSAAVSAAKMTMRAQYGNTGTPVLNIEIMDIMMAKTYPDGIPVFTVSNRVKTNPAYADTLVDVTLAAGNVLQVTSSGPDAVGVVYWTYSVTAFNQT